MGDAVLPPGMDTTIYLVQQSPGSPLCKKRKAQETSSMRVYANSGRLRQCSKYFEMCMNERWSQSSSPSFSLELQTDAVYYRDCFSRMKPRSFRAPIPSVTHALELIKVASQIMYEEVVDLAMTYLASTPWTEAEEHQIRTFCASGHMLVASEDLISRLRLHSTEKERQEEVSNVTQGEVLSHYLESIMGDFSTFLPERCEIFERAFRIIAFTSNDYAQQECITLVEAAVERVLLSFNDSRGSTFKDDVIGFCWLYGLLRSANAAQSVVETLLRERDVVHFTRCRKDLVGEARRKWVTLLHSLFQDVMDGRLFLTMSERHTLFMDWSRMFDTRTQDVFSDAEVMDLFLRYVMTFPLQDGQQNMISQQSMISYWENRMEDPNLLGTEMFFIYDTYEAWMMRLIERMRANEVEVEEAVEGETGNLLLLGPADDATATDNNLGADKTELHGLLDDEEGYSQLSLQPPAPSHQDGHDGF